MKNHASSLYVPEYPENFPSNSKIPKQSRYKSTRIRKTKKKSSSTHKKRQSLAQIRSTSARPGNSMSHFRYSSMLPAPLFFFFFFGIERKQKYPPAMVPKPKRRKSETSSRESAHVYRCRRVGGGEGFRPPAAPV